MPVTDSCNGDTINYRQRYRNLKRKFRYLIYENECFQDELKKAQRKLLKVNQDKSFLLDRLLQYERIEESSSDSDVTISSDSELDSFSLKKKKTPAQPPSQPPPLPPPTPVAVPHNFSAQGVHPAANRQASTEPAPKRKKTASKPSKVAVATSSSKPPEHEQPVVSSSRGDGHMTSEEIERHLESRQILLDLVPERAPPTVPTEMFSNDPSSMERYLMDDELNDGGADTSPSNIGDGFTEEDSLVIDLPEQDGCI